MRVGLAQGKREGINYWALTGCLGFSAASVTGPYCTLQGDESPMARGVGTHAEISQLCGKDFIPLALGCSIVVWGRVEEVCEIYSSVVT